LPLNTRRDNGLSWCLGVCLLVGACSTPKEKPAAPETAPTKHGLSAEQAALPLVKVADETVTVGEFAATIADKNPYLRARYASPERRRELLEELVKFELLGREAKRRGLDQLPEVERARRQVMVQQLMKAEFDDKVKSSDVTDAEIQAYYDAHPGEFHKPAQVRASWLVVKDEQKARRLLKQLQEKPTEQELFRELVRKESEDKVSAARDGDLAFFSLPKDRVPGDPTVPDAVAEAAFTLANVGDYAAEPVKVPQGHAIVRLTGKRKALERTLEQARRTVQNKLWREKREAAIAAFLANLRAQAHVEEHWDALAQVQVPVDPAAPKTPAPSAGKKMRSEP
jgi:peptidyl-prolyl cis-trans isomerase C